MAKSKSTEYVLGLSYPASEEDALAILDSQVHDDGRSEFVWIRLANGDLFVGVSPQGETYEHAQNVVNSDYAAAQESPNGIMTHSLPESDLTIATPLWETYKVRFRDPNVRSHVEAQTALATDGSNALERIYGSFPKYRDWGIASISVE